MKRAIILAATVALVLVSARFARADQSKPADASAAAPQTAVYDAASAFEFLKTLTGEWERSASDHEHGSSSRSVTYKVTAAGSSVMETIYPGDPSEMITIYHMDGDDLLLTHYCALQNAPVMKFEKSSKPGEIKFGFHGGTNFDPKADMHVHEGVMRIKDANTIESSFVTYSGGKPDGNPSGVLKRKPSKLSQRAAEADKVKVVKP
jgi:hypothetical protein